LLPDSQILFVTPAETQTNSLSAARFRTAGQLLDTVTPGTFGPGPFSSHAPPHDDEYCTHNYATGRGKWTGSNDPSLPLTLLPTVTPIWNYEPRKSPSPTNEITLAQRKFRPQPESFFAVRLTLDVHLGWRGGACRARNAEVQTKRL
jgi:hypothetical protein